MKKISILIALIIFIALIGLMTSGKKQTTSTKASEQPTPNPMPCDDLEHHPERSLVSNMNFNDFTNGQPNGWTVFVEGSASVNEERGYGIDAPDIRVDGSGNFKAGVYQIIEGLIPGKWYHAFYATAQQMWDTNGCKGENRPPYCGTAIQRDVGVDPTVGTNHNASSVIWGRATGGPADKEYGIWRTLGNQLYPGPLVSFIAKDNRATLFLRAMGFDNVGNSNTWIDAAYLAEACEQNVSRGSVDISTIAPTSQPSPTSTPTPILQITQISPTTRIFPTAVITSQPQITASNTLPFLTRKPTANLFPTQPVEPIYPQQLKKTKEVIFKIKVVNPYDPYRKIKKAVFYVNQEEIILTKFSDSITLYLSETPTQFKLKAVTSDNSTFETSGNVDFSQINNVTLTAGNPLLFFSKNIVESVFDQIDKVKSFLEILDKPFQTNF